MTDTATDSDRQTGQRGKAATGDGAGEWVSVSTAARRLGVSERTAQRHAVKLSDIDRQDGDGSQPRLVRLSALTERIRRSNPASLSDVLTDLDGHRPTEGEQSKREFVSVPSDRQDEGSDRHPDRQAANVATAALLEEKDARIADLQASIEAERTGRAGEVERLNAALERESTALHEAQGLHLGTMAELQRWQRRAEQLEAVNARLIEGAEGSVAETAETAPIAPEGDSPVVEGKSTQPAVQNAPEVKRAGFWARLTGRA